MIPRQQRPLPGSRRRPRLHGALLPLLLVLAGCPSPEEPDPADPSSYLEDVAYRRMVLERDLLDHDNDYAQRRLAQYGIEGERWEALPERAPPSRALTDADRALLAAGEPLTFDPASVDPIVPAELPVDAAGWRALGDRVFEEYPVRVAPEFEALAAIEDGLERSGFLQDADGGWVGLRVFEDGDGAVRVGPSCAQCHTTFGVDGERSPRLANKAMDSGLALLLSMGEDPDRPPPPPALASLAAIGPGRADVTADSIDNPLALPDLGGLIDQPYLQMNANWFHREPATLAIRCETLFIRSNSERSRPPRPLAWAVAAWIGSLPPPDPLDGDPGPPADRGAAVFADAGCDACHSPPLYTSDRRVELEEVGTDLAALDSPERTTGFVRIPSLRGVGRTGPYLHHGAVPSLEAFFDPEREEPGHRFGLELSEGDRDDLLAFLRSI